MDYKDCIIVYKHGKGIALRATRLTVENKDGMIIVFNGDDIMALVPLTEIKTVVFADCADYDTQKSIIEAISNIT